MRSSESVDDEVFWDAMPCTVDKIRRSFVSIYRMILNIQAVR